MPGHSGGGLIVTASEGKDYGDQTFSQANQAEQIVDPGESVATVVVRGHPSNGGIVFVGFDDQVTVDDGLPLEASDWVGLDLDISQAELWAVADTADDSVRFLTFG